MKRAEGNLLMAMRLRTKYAKKLFRPEAVATAIDNRAFEGYRHYRLVQEHPFDLSDTDAAKRLEQWLASEQFQYMWRPTFIPQDELRPPISGEYPELVIVW